MTIKAVVILIIIRVFSLGTLLNATASQDQIIQAHEAYKAGKFEQAEHLYQQSSNTSPHVYYNIGNCYYKQGKLGQALLYWRKAEIDWGIQGRRDLYDNIALVQKQLQAKHIRPNTVPHSLTYIKSTVTSYIISTPLLWLQILTILSWILIFLALKYWSRLRSKIVIGILLCSCLSTQGLLAYKYWLRMTPVGIVIAQQAPLLSGPGSQDEYRQLCTVYEGDEGTLEKRSGDYVKIVFKQQRGWLHNNTIGIV